MSALQKSATAALLLLLAAAGYGLWVTREPQLPAQAPPSVANSRMPVIDEDPLRTAQRLARLANTAEEQPLAQAAVQAADHELDLAFMAALHGIQSHPPVLSPEALKIQAHIADAQKRLAGDTELLEKLAQKMGKATEAEKPDLQDQLDLAGSQIEIEKDEIQEGNDDLMAAGGDVHQRIQKAQAEHLAAESNTAPPLPAATVSRYALSSLHGMVAQLREWLQLRAKRGTLEQARHEVATGAAKLAEQRAKIAADFASVQQQLAQLGGKPPAAATPPPTPPTPAGGAGNAPAANSLLALTRQVAIDQRRLMVRDQRISARQQALRHLRQVGQRGRQPATRGAAWVARPRHGGARGTAAAAVRRSLAHGPPRSRPPYRSAPVRHAAQRHRCRPAGDRGAAHPASC